MNIQRDFSTISEKAFDVVVIGGGINGAGIAWDAALRGHSVLLLEKSDFGAATSAACFKVIHGGLRYLQRLDFKHLRESVREQRTLRQIAPHLVHPLPFIVPCYGHGARGRAALQLALTIYDLLACDRNLGVEESLKLPAHRFLSKEQVLKIAPLLSSNNLRGAVQYYDAQLSNCERMTLAVVRAAAAAGASVFNYAEVVGFTEKEAGGDVKSIEAVKILDRETGKEFTVATKFVVNAAGPWIRQVLDLAEEPTPKPRVRFSKGIQVVVPSVIATAAIALESKYVDQGNVLRRGGRSYFLVPWRGKTLAGTTDEAFTEAPDRFGISAEEANDFLKELSELYPAIEFKEQSERYAFGGLREVIERADAELTVDHKDYIFDHKDLTPISKRRVANLISALGVKYTTFRAMAERTVDCLEKRLGVQNSCLTAVTTLPGAGMFNFQEFRESAMQLRPEFLSEAQVDALLENYGSEINALYELMAENFGLRTVIGPSENVFAAEVVKAVRDEYACHLADVIFRRTTLASFGFPGDEALQEVTEIMAELCSWDQQRIELELAATYREFEQKHGVEFKLGNTGSAKSRSQSE